MIRSPRVLGLLFLTGLGRVVLAPRPAKAGFSQDCPFGVNAHQASDDELDLAAAAGIGWVRMDFNWEQFEPSRGTYDWTVPDRFVARAEDLGLNVFATVAYTPDWAVSGSCDDSASEASEWCRNAVPASASYWSDFITAAVGRYGDRIKHWGMWNEPNLEHFFRGTSTEYVATILEPGSAAVHDACGDCFVLGPELAHMRGSDSWNGEEGVCAFGECIFNGWEVSLREVLQESASSIDIVTHHNYEGSSSEMWEELTDGEYLANVQYMHGVKEITDSYAPGKPVWLTEFGYESTPGGEFSESEAAHELQESFEDLFDVQMGSHRSVVNQPWPELEKLFWYDLTDDPTTYDWGTFTWGLLEDDYTPKEAWYTYADVTNAHGGCWEDAEEEDPGSDTGGDSAPDSEQDPVQDTGDPTSDEDTDNTGPDPDSVGDAADSGAGSAAEATTSPNGARGCGCSTSGGPGWMALLLALPLVVPRRA